MKKIFHDFKNDLAGVERGVDSEMHFGSLLDKLYPPKGETLKEQKQHALARCKEAIPHFTNSHVIEFYLNFRDDPRLQYLNEERGIYGYFWKYGHTNTHKEIMGLLKERLIQNLKRNIVQDRGLYASIHQRDLMFEIIEARSGRKLNLLAMLGMNVGQTGEFNAEYNHATAKKSL